MEKRGISPLIATVLLIALTVSMAGMIYAWSRSFAAEQLEKFGSHIETVCSEIDYFAQLNSPSGAVYELLINNRANVDIQQVNIKLFKQGSSIIRTFTPSNGAVPKAGTGKVSFTLSDFDMTSFDSAEITPLLLGKGDSGKTKLHPCTDKTMKVMPQ